MNKIYMLIFAAGTFIFASCGEKTKTETSTETTTEVVKTAEGTTTTTTTTTLKPIQFRQHTNWETN
jgi:hypothetical protein